MKPKTDTPTTTPKTRKPRTPRTLSPEELEARSAIDAAKQKLATARKFGKLRTVIDKLTPDVRELLVDYLEQPCTPPAPNDSVSA